MFNRAAVGLVATLGIAALSTSVAAAAATPTTPVSTVSNIGNPVTNLGITLGTGAASAAGSSTINLGPTNADAVSPIIPAGTPIAQAQDWLQNALTVRSQQLTTLVSTVASTKLIATDRSAMNGLLTSTIKGINALTNASSDDATLAAIRVDASAMVLNFRVFSFVTPIVQGIIKADTTQIALQADNSLQPGIKAAIAANQQAKKRVATAKALQADLASQLSSGLTLVNAVVDSLESQVVSDFADASLALTNAKTHTDAANTDLAAANADISSIVQTLASATLSAKITEKFTKTNSVGAYRTALRRLAKQNV